MSAAASLGMLLLWDVEGGLSQIDKYMISTDEHIKAGALLAVGIVNSTVRNEHEPALALLTGMSAIGGRSLLLAITPSATAWVRRLRRCLFLSYA